MSPVLPPANPLPQSVLPALPGLPSLVAALDRGWDSQAATQEASAPALVSQQRLLPLHAVAGRWG